VDAAGAARHLVAGSPGPEPWRVLLLRVEDASRAAAAVEGALRAEAEESVVLDPAASGGCGGEEGHGGPGTLPVPRARVVRVRLPAAALDRAAAAAGKAAGAAPSLDASLGGAGGGTARLDCVLVE